MKAIQVSELDPVKLIIYHEPHTVETIGYIHPVASLFGDIPNYQKSRQAYEDFRRVVKKYNLHSAEVTDILTRDRSALIELAKESCQYIPSAELVQQNEATITEEYKNSVLSKLDNETLLGLVYSRPKVYLKKENVNTFITIEKIEIDPLSNLVFIRDQQIVTAKGLVIGNTKTTVRKFEKTVLKKCFEILKIKPLAEAPEECCIEGGDYMSINKDLCLLHIGIRSNQEGANFLMENDLLGTKRFGVVKDEVDCSQQRMHLDTVFNLINENTVIMVDFDDPALKPEFRRTIDLYQRSEDGKYSLVESLDFMKFLERQGFRIILVSNKDQEEFMVNFLCLGKFDDNYVLVTSNKNFEEVCRKHKVNNVTVEYLESFREVNKMHGSFHCATQVFREKPL